jgi:muconolactone D-isomerase
MMLFHVRMDVHLPPDLDPATRTDLITREKARAIELQEQGVWPQLWRVVGEYANFSVFDVPTNDDLHDVLSSLPLFPYLTIHVTPLATHPSKI